MGMVSEESGLSLPQPVKFQGWKMHTHTRTRAPANRILFGPITNLLWSQCILMQFLLYANAKKKKSLRISSFHFIGGVFQVTVQLAWQWRLKEGRFSSVGPRYFPNTLTLYTLLFFSSNVKKTHCEDGDTVVEVWIIWKNRAEITF